MPRGEMHDKACLKSRDAVAVGVPLAGTRMRRCAPGISAVASLRKAPDDTSVRPAAGPARRTRQTRSAPDRSPLFLVPDWPLYSRHETLRDLGPGRDRRYRRICAWQSNWFAGGSRLAAGVCGSRGGDGGCYLVGPASAGRGGTAACSSRSRKRKKSQVIATKLAASPNAPMISPATCWSSIGSKPQRGSGRS